jgi:hypothetical protein
MARKRQTTTGVIAGSIKKSSLQTTDSTLRAIKDYLPIEEFYELEPVEILEVHLDDTKETFPKQKGKDGGKPDYSYVGGILGRYVYSEQGKNIDKCKNFKSINPNVNTVPAVGEIVIGVKYLGQYYYTTQLNLFGNPNFNTQHGVSRKKIKGTFVSNKSLTTPNADEEGTEIGYYLKRIEDFRKLLPHEGDVIIEGRFGNSIRIGSDIKKENIDSPNIILNVGQSKDEFPEPKQPVEEKIDTDGSSVYLTTNQKLEFTPGIESKVVTAPYEGKNILLSSDRIIFNTKNGGDIGMFSHNNVSIGAVKEVVIESPITKIGSSSATEPMVLGNKLESVLNDILTLIETGLLAPTGPVQVVPGQAILQKLKSALGVPSIKSPKNLVE